MIVKEINVSNFKSFKNLHIVLDRFNVIIGANASGKSNFIQILKFMHDITVYGLDNAISLQGGVEYFRNTSIGNSSNFSLKIVYDMSDNERVRINKIKGKTGSGLLLYKLIHEFEIVFKKRGEGFRIVSDKLTLMHKCVEINREEKPPNNIKEIGSLDYCMTKSGREFKTKVDLSEGLELDYKLFFPDFLKSFFSQSNDLLIQSAHIFMHPDTRNIFSNMAIYDFDPKLLKKASSISGKNELEEDGSNLAIVLKKIIENKEKKRMFSNLIKDLLPFVDDLSIEKTIDKSILFKLREVYSKKTYFPSSLMSDGTVNVTALITALYFQEKSLAIFEEPERTIHPYLISRIIGMTKEASTKKQVIITTHNPEIVKNADIENLYLVSRCTEGFSTIRKPYEMDEVKHFLKNEIGIDELYIQNLLEV